MNRVTRCFTRLKSSGEKAFIVYITAGDPSLRDTEKLVLALEKSGADIIELGVPFSDPLADGPTIQAASHRALKRGANLPAIFTSVERLRRNTDIPIVFMTYFNPVFRYGVDRFLRDCKRYGVDGIICPDLPYEEAGAMIRLGRKLGVATIFLAAPTSTVGRIKKITRVSTGFIYYVSLTGVTGARRKLPTEIVRKVRLVKSYTSKPVCVGFGVSDAAQAAHVASISDGVIVGSAVVKLIEKHSGKSTLIPAVSNFTNKLAKAVHNA